MSAAAPSLDTQVEASPAVEIVSQAENDATYAEPEVTVWIFDPSICG
ncbi:MAG: hypothetical protein ACH34X_04650 [Thiolinea sp.]